MTSLQQLFDQLPKLTSPLRTFLHALPVPDTPPSSPPTSSCSSPPSLLLPLLFLFLPLSLLSLLLFARLFPSQASTLINLLPYFPGKCTLVFTHSSNPIHVFTRSSPSPSSSSSPHPQTLTSSPPPSSKLSLPDLIRKVTPPCNLNPFLFNGHLQTFWTAVKYVGPPIWYKRRVFHAEETVFHGTFAVDFVTAVPPSPPPSPTSREGKDVGKEEGKREEKKKEKGFLFEDPTGVGHTELPPRTSYFTDEEFEGLRSEDRKPLLITLHGLSGGSYEVYLRHVLESLVKSTPAGGRAGGVSGGDWEALVINSRGCAGSEITSSLLYNARATWDVRQVVRWCRKVWPNRPLFAVGYSIGANILTNYLAEEGSNCVLTAAVVVSNPWNLDIAAAALLRTTLGRKVYSKTMGGNMFSLYRMHKEQIVRNKRVPRRVAITSDTATDMRLLHNFDRSVQCASWGYPTEGAYYRDASCVDAIMGVRVPLLCIGSTDDPIAVDEGVPYEEIRQNPYVVMVTTNGGGHLAWFEIIGGRWHWKPAVGFLNAMAHDVDHNHKDRPKFQSRTRSEMKPPFTFSPMRRKAHYPRTELD